MMEYTREKEDNEVVGGEGILRHAQSYIDSKIQNMRKKQRIRNRNILSIV